MKNNYNSPQKTFSGFEKKNCKTIKTIVIIFAVTLIIFLGKVYYSNNTTEVLLERKSQHSKLLSVYLEDTEGNYILSNDSSFPTGSYDFNKEKSYCVNKSSLEYDEDNLKIKITTSGADNCYVYFDYSSIALSSKILMNSTKLENVNESKKAIEIKGDPLFSVLATTEEGMYATEDDYGTSYYFRGVQENNYVLFADMLWRIVRIDGEGNVKLMLFNESSSGTSYRGINSSSSYLFNSVSTNPIYVGYMYSTSQLHGNNNSSNIKNILDAWYETKILNTINEKYVSQSTIFCNDRSSYSSTAGTTEYSSYTTSTQYFGPYIRIYTTVNPTLKCSNVSDAFSTIETEVSNDYLDYPIGLISADEVFFAGSAGSANVNIKYYLSADVSYWTVSPYFYYSSYAYMFIVNRSPYGYLGYGSKSVYMNAFSVISLTANSEYNDGDGSLENPYTIKI